MFRDTLYLRTSRVKQSVLGLPDTASLTFRVQQSVLNWLTLDARTNRLPATSVTTNQHYVIAQKNEYLIYTAAEACFDAKLHLFVSSLYSAVPGMLYLYRFYLIYEK
jgi:hypothetical protein